MIVNVFDQQNALNINSDAVPQLVQEVILEEGQACDEVNIYFVDLAAISQLHDDFFNDPSPTDCISFTMDDEEEDLPYRILGEVFVCPATAQAYCVEREMDPYEETALYIVHGLLHLMGYDDLEEKDCERMRQAEVRQMEILKSKGLIDLFRKSS